MARLSVKERKDGLEERKRSGEVSIERDSTIIGEKGEKSLVRGRESLGLGVLKGRGKIGERILSASSPLGRAVDTLGRWW